MRVLFQWPTVAPLLFYVAFIFGHCIRRRRAATATMGLAVKVEAAFFLCVKLQAAF